MGQRTTVKDPDGRERTEWTDRASVVVVWDTQTGKALKMWEYRDASVRAAFNPVHPVLAILEWHGDGTRVGFWDFAAEVEKK